MAGSPAAVVDVGLARPGVPYSRNMFGHFIEHFHRQVYGGVFEPSSPLSDERGFRKDVLEAMRELRPSVVRWPGGCFVSSYHWLDGVGPTRHPHYDKAWRVTDPNTFGTREFVAWCAAIGADPYICLNAGTGTAEEMSDWVEYCNLPAGTGRWSDLRSSHGEPAPFRVPFWSIGNENYGSWEIGAKRPDEWAHLVGETAKMIRRVDESAQLLTAAQADPDWTLPLLRAAGPYLDTVSIHGYWDTLAQVNEPSDYRTALKQSLGPQHDIARTEAIIAVAGLDGRVGIAFDEWNLRGWHHPTGTSREAIAARDLNDDNSCYTMADALFTAGFLNSCLRRAEVVTMANISPSINTRGPLFVHESGVVRRTTFHVLQLYATLLGSRVLASAGASSELSGSDVPVFDQLATVDDDYRIISLVLINRSPDESLHVSVRIAGRLLDGTFDSTVLDGDSPDAYNDVDRPGAVVPRRTRTTFAEGGTVLPPHSLTVCRIGLPIDRPVRPAGVDDVVAGAWALSERGWHRAGAPTRVPES